MKIFNTLQELTDYVPNCIICGKQLELHLNGNVTVINAPRKYLHFRLKIKEELFLGKNKNYSFTINPIDNTIINGQATINDIIRNWFYVFKKCYTCQFEIIAKYIGPTPENYMVGNFKNLPPLTLDTESLFYTRKREKSVSIRQVHLDNETIQTSIIINNKRINPLYIDFNKFKNLNHLNERLSTILTFS